MTRPYRYITRKRADIICPECAGPKHRQSKRCAACYYDARRRGEYPPPPAYRKSGPDHHAWKGGTGHRATGQGKGRPQPQSHPWRKENALLFVKRRVEQMADEGTRPATAGGRMRAHFATVTTAEGKAA